MLELLSALVGPSRSTPPTPVFPLTIPEASHSNEGLNKVWGEVLDFLESDLTSGFRFDRLLEGGVEVVEARRLQYAPLEVTLGRWFPALSVTYLRGQRWGVSSLSVYTESAKYREEAKRRARQWPRRKR